MALTQVPSGMIASTAQYTGFKNRLMNGCMRVAQRATSATVTAGTAVPTSSTGYPCVDRWFVYSTGANVTAAQVAGSSTAQNRLQITGAASVTAVGVGQRIEANNSYDLNGQVVTLSVDMANSVLTTVTWTVSYANTADTFGTIGTPTKTQIATGTFTVNSSVTNYNAQITIPSAATTGLEVLFTVGAQTSGTWTIGNPQLELGSSATIFDYRPLGTELQLCQRYLPAFLGNGNWFGFGIASNATQAYATVQFPVTTRVAPTGITVSAASDFVVSDAIAALSTATSISFNTAGQQYSLLFVATSAGGLTTARPTTFASNNANARLLFTGCEL